MSNNAIASSYGYPTTATFLSSLIEMRVFRNRVEPYLDSQLRGSNDSWYTKKLVADGRQAAEQELAEWTAERGLNAFADAIGATASGLLALARLDDETQPAGDNDDNRRQPAEPRVKTINIDGTLQLGGLYNYTDGVLFLSANPTVRGCGCTQPQGYTVFGRGGEIGLRSIGLAVDKYLHKASLLLLLPHPQYRSAGIEQTRLGFASIRIDSDGHTHGQQNDYRFTADPVDFALGLVKPENLVQGSMMSSGINAALDFPDSEAYLARHIPQLGSYLQAAAAKLGGQHQH